MQGTIRVDRDKYIGGSDIPAIMGISPFRTRWELVREKALGEMPDFDGNIYTEYGNEMEPKIREYVNKACKRNFVEDKWTMGNIRYHADGYDETHHEFLEIKTTGEYDDKKRTMYLVQLLFGMYNAGAEDGILAVYERPDDMNTNFDALRLSIERIHRSENTELVNRIIYAVKDFVADVEKLRQNPNMTESDLLPAQITNLANQIEDMEAQLEQYAVIKAHYDDMKENLRQMMNDCGIKSWQTPSGTKITLVLDGEDKTVKELDVKAMQEAEPDVCGKYMVEKIKKGRKGYVRITYHESED